MHAVLCVALVNLRGSTYLFVGNKYAAKEMTFNSHYSDSCSQLD